ncbi:MAG: hypothetical protein ACR2I2_17255 [Bryobacteraceae bacterium]
MQASRRTRIATGIPLFLALCAVFLILNRAAYKGYFQDDELDNISWAPRAPMETWVRGFLTPRFDADNFRPTGHLYFAEMGKHFGLDFPKYVIPIHLLHLLNAGMVWLLARKVQAGRLAAWSAAVFFALNVAAFDAYWKPMYVFDVMCASFCLLSILLFAHERWILSFLAFWLAYKSKELAVMLPAVLAAYEYWFGKRRWKPLAPFFLISASFGMQGILLNPNKDNDYTFRFSLAALKTTVPFYSSRLLLIPYGGVAILALALLRDRRIRFGIAAMCLFFLPLIFLPGRLFPAYCYLPLTGVSIAVAGLISLGETAHPRAIVPVVIILFAIWMRRDIQELRRDRSGTLAADNGARAFVTAIQNYAKAHPKPRTVVYDSVPPGLHHWGVTAAVNIAYHQSGMESRFIDSPEAREALKHGPVTFMSWDEQERRVHFTARDGDANEAAYITMGHDTPPWQLVSGWLGIDGYFQWIEPQAIAYLRRPPDASKFELNVNVSPELIRKTGHSKVEVRLNGVTIGAKDFTAAGWQRGVWALPEGHAGHTGQTGQTRVDFLVSPGFPADSNNKRVGIAIVSFGFLPPER